MTVDVEQGCTAQPVRTILRVEAALVLLALLFVYWLQHASWLLFVIFLLAPDLAMVGYVRGSRVGAWSYNASHSYVGPLITVAFALQYHSLIVVAVIWASHIAFDRALGYGLKYPDSFGHTHLGTIGAHRREH